MVSDIRTFFGRPQGTSSEKSQPSEERSKKRGRPKKVVSDDEDDEPTPKKQQPRSIVTKKNEKEEPGPDLKETTAVDYFGKGKPKRTGAVRPTATVKDQPVETPKKSHARTRNNTSTPNGRSSARTKKKINYNLDADEFPDDDVKGEADEFKAAVAAERQIGDDYEESGDADEPPVLKKKDETKHKGPKGDRKADSHEDAKIENRNAAVGSSRVMIDRPAKATPTKTSGKRKSTALDDEDEDPDMDVAKRVSTPKRTGSAKKATPVSKKSKTDEPQNSGAVQAIFDSIPMVKPPSPPPQDGDAGKKKFQYGQHANSAIPAGALESSELPQGAENCLAGLVFVFTGQLQRLGREQGQNLVKQYGGKITTAPSKKTSFVVLGEDAGPKKLGTIKQYDLKVINEEGLFELIRRLPANGGDSVAAEKFAEKQAKEEESIRKAAEEIEEQERARVVTTKPKPQQSLKTTQSDAKHGKANASAEEVDARLWTVRYAPQQLSQICGNKTQVEKLQRWLRAFPKNQSKGFKLPGPDGSGTHRAVMIHGPPGIGKTTAAHLVAKTEGYDIVESNASDTRSKKLVENGLKGVLSTTSLMGYFSHGSEDIEASKKKLVLIMDEVDGMSAGDRGGVGALAAVCKKTQIPMILICNDRRLPKMKPFDFVTFDLGFRRPTTDQIRSRIMTIAFREGLKMPPNVINALIEGSGADIRQVVNMISTAKLDSQNMSFEESKDMSKAWEKHIVLKPWDMVGKILGGGLFNPASKSTLNDKTELYFNDHEFAPLMLQENYLGTNPQRTNKHNDNPKLKNLALLDLVGKAADSISDGDLVDRMIHGSQQQWSLMPTHAIFSFVRPASFVYGSMAGHRTGFTSWLGNNSKQGKLARFIKEIQGHMRLRTSADRHEIRQTYVPVLFDMMIKKLERDGKDSVTDIIALMDSYFLTKDDWDAILELGVGNADMEKIKIETQAKATFTRLYNLQTHPLPFMKASQVVAPKKAPTKEKPDLEEALEESEDEPVDDADVQENEDDVDLSKDKYVKQPKKKKGAATVKAGGSKTNEREDEEAAGKPKRGKGKGRAKN